MRLTLAAVAALAACNHHRPLDNAAVADMRGNLVEIKTVQNEEMRVIADAPNGSLVFHAPEGDIELGNVREITEVRRLRGALEGLGIGVLVGGTIGAVLGLADGDDEPCSDHGGCVFELKAGEKAVVFGVFLAMPGGLLGLLIGVARGSHMIYDATAPVQSRRFTPSGPPGSVAGMTYRF